ncbi:MAG: hypothetical protein ACI9U2_002517 [Bradymonadia bacterium]
MIGAFALVLGLAQPAPVAAPAPAPSSTAPAAPDTLAPSTAAPVAGPIREIVPQPVTRPPIREIVPRAVTPQRTDSILLDSVEHEGAWWIQPSLMGTIYDPRRDLVIARWSPGLAVGRRFSRWGLQGQIEFDETLDFTLDTKVLNVLNLGVGGEYLSFLGHVRSSLTLGVSVLLSDTIIDDAGEVGWYIDVRPGALRWSVSKQWTFEFTPISLDIIVPVPTGIPLVIYAYGTVVSIEWASL